MSDKPQLKPVTKIQIGESFTIAKEHKGGSILSHTTVTLYPNDPVSAAAFAAVLNHQVAKRPSLLAVIGVGRQVWPPTVTTQNVDVSGSTAGIPCGIGQYAAALAVAKLVEEDIITQDVGDSLAGIVVQQFHHWELKMEDAEQILFEQYTGARAAILKAFAGGGSLEDTKKNAGHVHELVSNGAFGNIDPARIPAILKGECKPIEPKAA